MSITLIVYSPDPPLGRDVLAHACVDYRLPKNFHWKLGFLPDDKVVGWKPDSPEAEQVPAAVAANDRAALDELYQREAVAVIHFYVLTRDTPRWKDVVDDEEIEATPADLRDAVEDARTRYSLETSASRNDLSLDFQYQLWRVVGLISNGLMHDPQEGQYVTKDGQITQVEGGVADPEIERELARIDRIERGQQLLTVGAAALLAIQAVAIPFVAQRLGPRQLLTAVLQLGLVGLFWYLARKGEDSGYWGLVFVAFGFAGRWAWALITPPPSPLPWTILQAVRTVVHVAAGIVLLLPATRAYVAYRSAD